MAYLSASGFVDEFGEREARQLTDLEGTGAPVMARLEAKLTEASDIADGYLGRRYSLPLSTSAGPMAAYPANLKRAVADIARYLLTGTQVMSTEDIRARYKDALSTLDQIASGKLSIGLDVNMVNSGTASLGGSTAVRATRREFSDDRLGGML